jgi:hypothetical protein
MRNITFEILDLNSGNIPGLIHNTNKSTVNFSVIEGKWRIPIERITTMTASEVLAATGVIKIYTAIAKAMAKDPTAFRDSHMDIL